MSEDAISHAGATDCPPVLLLIFNRPDLTERVFEQVRQVQPKSLFIAADGPRPSVFGENQLCEATREVVSQIDWDCEVQTLFRSENLGLKRAVSRAIDWFFEQVDEGIILEDDCVPNRSFFYFCGQMLSRYRHDERIMAISGNNFQEQSDPSGDSYYFSIYNHIWGWATWRRAWRLYDEQMKMWPQLRKSAWLQGLLGDPQVAEYWCRIFDNVCQDRIESWGYVWTFSCWSQSGLTILPKVNLVSNIGFDERATHTRNRNSTVACRPLVDLEFPLKHPLSVVRDYRADLYTSRRNFVGAKSGGSLLARARRKVRAELGKRRQQSKPG